MCIPADDKNVGAELEDVIFASADVRQGIIDLRQYESLQLRRLILSYAATKIPAYGASRIAEGTNPLKSSLGPDLKMEPRADGKDRYLLLNILLLNGKRVKGILCIENTE